MKKLEIFVNKFSNVLGYLISVALILMMINVSYDAISRYIFNINSVAMQELEWHLFSIVILLGLSYALNKDGHVRVDFLYCNFTEKTKAIINMAGVFVFIMPISLLIFFGSFDFVSESFQLMEQSGDPGGLQYRFIVKSLIPISFFILIFTSLGVFAKNYNIYASLKQENKK